MGQDGGNARGRNLSGANLSGSNFSGKDLSGANLSGANLGDADLTDADLSDANLSGATLRNTRLVGADLDGATLSGATLRNAVLEPGDTRNEAVDSRSSWAVEWIVVSVIAVLVLGVAHIAGAGFWLALVAAFVAIPAGFRGIEWYGSRSDDEDSGEQADGERTDDEQTPLARLRERYTNGEIDEAEFERRVEHLLETESLDDTETVYGDSGSVDDAVTTDGDAGAAGAEPERDVE
jgi:hypothetical protein